MAGHGAAPQDRMFQGAVMPRDAFFSRLPHRITTAAAGSVVFLTACAPERAPDPEILRHAPVYLAEICPELREQVEDRYAPRLAEARARDLPADEKALLLAQMRQAQRSMGEAVEQGCLRADQPPEAAADMRVRPGETPALAQTRWKAERLGAKLGRDVLSSL